MENIKVKIELPIAKWNVILKGAGQLPFVEVAEIIAEIKQQADPQMMPAPQTQTVNAMPVKRKTK